MPTPPLASPPTAHRLTLSLLLALGVAGLAGWSEETLGDTSPWYVRPPIKTAALTKDVGVVIANAQYKTAVGALPTAANDGAAISAYLEDTLGIKGPNLKEATDASATTMRSALAAAATAVQPAVAAAKARGLSPADPAWPRVVVYYAGHAGGIPGTNQRGFLGVDAPTDTDAAYWLPTAEVLATAGRTGATVVLLDDACGAQGRLAIPAGAVPEGVKAVTLSATSPDQEARPLKGTQNGAFTVLLLLAYRGWADGEPVSPRPDGGKDPRDGKVSLRELRDFVSRRLKEAGQQGQTPSATVAIPGAGAGDLVMAAAPLPFDAKDPNWEHNAFWEVEPRRIAGDCDALCQAERLQTLFGEVEAARAAAQVAATADWKRLQALTEQSPAQRAVLFLDRHGADTVHVQNWDFLAVPDEAVEAWYALGPVRDNEHNEAGRPKVQPPGPNSPGLGDEVVRVPTSTFWMGCREGELPCDDDEKPTFLTTVESFLVSRTMVSQALWRATLPTEPWRDYSGGSEGATLPAAGMSWCEAAYFTNELSERQRLPKAYSKLESEGDVAVCEGDHLRVKLVNRRGWHLLTEAEYEAAARAGGRRLFGEARTEDELPLYALVTGPEGSATDPPVSGERPAAGADRFRSNRLGLVHMVGFVGHWVSDVYSGGYSPAGSPTLNRLFEGPGPARVLRGGSLNLGPNAARPGLRDWCSQDQYCDRVGGLRLARSE